MTLAAREAVQMQPDLFWLAVCAALGMTCGYLIGRLISSARGDWDMRALGAFLGLVVGVVLFLVGVKEGP